MSCLDRDYQIRHNFTVAYVPWVNETMERVIAHLQSTFQCLMSEMMLGQHDRSSTKHPQRGPTEGTWLEGWRHIMDPT